MIIELFGVCPKCSHRVVPHPSLNGYKRCNKCRMRYELGVIPCMRRTLALATHLDIQIAFVMCLVVLALLYSAIYIAGNTPISWSHFLQSL